MKLRSSTESVRILTITSINKHTCKHTVLSIPQIWATWITYLQKKKSNFSKLVRTECSIMAQLKAYIELENLQTSAGYFAIFTLWITHDVKVQNCSVTDFTWSYTTTDLLYYSFVIFFREIKFRSSREWRMLDFMWNRI